MIYRARRKFINFDSERGSSIPLRNLVIFIAGLLIFLLVNATPAYLQAITPSPFPDDPAGCQRPPDDYSRVLIGTKTLNRRTLAMLAQAQTLYGGSIDLTGIAITQGSYNEGVTLSFGTHDGGGAIDLSVHNIPTDWSILWDDIPHIIDALRKAGFAAWFRSEVDDMSPHIHAIAIGDEEQSRAAALQLEGRYGYFRGFNALPQPDGVPLPDTSGELVLCQWMRDLGYDDWRDETTVILPPYYLTIGRQVMVNTILGQELNFRSQAGLKANIITALPAETPLTIIGGSRLVDGYRWWQVLNADGLVGWVVEAVADNLILVP